MKPKIPKLATGWAMECAKELFPEVLNWTLRQRTDAAIARAAIRDLNRAAKVIERHAKVEANKRLLELWKRAD